MSVLAAANVAAPEHRSWNWFIALIVGYVGFRIVTFFWRKWQEASPTPLSLPAGVKEKVQATVGVNTGSGTDDTEQITLPRATWHQRGGVWFRQAKQIVKTGSAEVSDVDDEVDVALDDAEPMGPPPPDEDGLPAGRSQELVKYIDTADSVRVPYNRIVQVIVDNYGVSVRTAKRRIAEARALRKDAAA